jgi:hypothetical protein
MDGAPGEESRDGFVVSHPSHDETARWMGHPAYFVTHSKSRRISYRVAERLAVSPLGSRRTYASLSDQCEEFHWPPFQWFENSRRKRQVIRLDVKTWLAYPA